MLAAGISDETMSAWRRIAAGDEYWPRSDSPVQPETRDRITRFTSAVAEAQADCMEVLHNALYTNGTTINPKTGHTDTQALREVLGKHPGSRQDWYEMKHITTDATITHRREDSLTTDADDAALEQWSMLALPDSNSK